MAEPIQQVEIIQYTGADVLDPDQKRLLDKICTDEYSKVKRSLNNVTSLSVHIKTHSKSGSKPKYSVHLKVIAPTRIFATDKSISWDFAAAVHMAFDSVHNEIQKAFKEVKAPHRTSLKYAQ
jgi:hypothetical protein